MSVIFIISASTIVIEDTHNSLIALLFGCGTSLLGAVFGIVGSVRHDFVTVISAFIYSTSGKEITFSQYTVLKLMGGWGNPPPLLPIVVPGSKTALQVLSPPLKLEKIEKINCFTAYPPDYFFANSSTDSIYIYRCV